MLNEQALPVDMTSIDFEELEDRYGHENARAILRTLEIFEGVKEAEVVKISWQDRLRNVFDLMNDNARFQTKH